MIEVCESFLDLFMCLTPSSSVGSATDSVGFTDSTCLVDSTESLLAHLLSEHLILQFELVDNLLLEYLGRFSIVCTGHWFEGHGTHLSLVLADLLLEVLDFFKVGIETADLAFQQVAVLL